MLWIWVVFDNSQPTEYELVYIDFNFKSHPEIKGDDFLLSSGFTSEQPLTNVSSLCLRSCLFVSGVTNLFF